MPTLAELLLALTTEQPLALDDKREVELHIMLRDRRIREAPSNSDAMRASFATSNARIFGQCRCTTALPLHPPPSLQIRNGCLIA